jgi:hypothetical protein
MLRKAAERTIDGLWTAIGRLIDTFTPAEYALKVDHGICAGQEPAWSDRKIQSNSLRYRWPSRIGEIRQKQKVEL